MIDLMPTGPEYPGNLEGHVNLRDGRHVFVRPILPSDGDDLRAAMTNADDVTIRSRFLGWRPDADDELIKHLTEVDYRWRLALVAIDDEGTGVAIARYEGEPGRDVAEAAIVVDPGWRRVGLATYLLGRLGDAALERGIRRFWATFLGNNAAVEGLLRSIGLPHRTSISAGVVEIVVDLSPVRCPEQPPGS
jgi:GNAT superfamily N-acetyltransferase